MSQCHDYRASASHNIVNWLLTWTKNYFCQRKFVHVSCLPTSPTLAPVMPRTQECKQKNKTKGLYSLHMSCLTSLDGVACYISFCSTGCLLTKRASWLQIIFPLEFCRGKPSKWLLGHLCADGCMHKLFCWSLFLNWLKINWLTISSWLKVTRNLWKIPFLKLRGYTS